MQIAICDCKEIFESEPAEDWFRLRQRMDAAGWQYFNNRWRCLSCHNKFLERRSKRKKAS